MKAIDLVLQFLKGDYIEYEKCSNNEVLINMKDVNAKIDELSWEEWLEDCFNRYNIKLKFGYGDGNWVTIQIIQ